MNKEQFLKEMKIFEAQIQVIKEKISDLNKKYVETSPFKIGEKVLIRSGDSGKTKERIAFIGNIHPPSSFTRGDFRYEFLGCKKDGTMSRSSAGIYHYDSIEKFKE